MLAPLVKLPLGDDVCQPDADADQSDDNRRPSCAARLTGFHHAATAALAPASRSGTASHALMALMAAWLLMPLPLAADGHWAAQVRHSGQPGASMAGGPRCGGMRARQHGAALHWAGGGHAARRACLGEHGCKERGRRECCRCRGENDGP